MKINIKKQVIIVDDSSRDGSDKILNKFKNKVDKIITHKKNQGKGAAIKSAQKYIKGIYVAIQDADLEYNPNDLKKLVKNKHYNFLETLAEDVFDELFKDKRIDKISLQIEKLEIMKDCSSVGIQISKKRSHDKL